MKKLIALTALLSAGQAFAYHPPTPQLQQEKLESNRYLVTFKHSISPVESPLLSAEQRIHQLNGTPRHIIDKYNTIAAELSEAALQQLQKDPSVLSIEKDPIRKLAHTGYTTYGIKMIQTPLLAQTTSSDQKVCVIDTGYDASHEDLPNGANITGEVIDNLEPKRNIGNWYEDSHGHGTHITGTLTALSNSVGFEGIFPNGALKIHHVKVIDHLGYWQIYGSDIIAAVKACENAGATVVNMSVAGWWENDVEERALQDAYDNGMLLIAANGNYGDKRYLYPAAYKSVIGVGAIDKNKKAWMFNQTHDQVELVAPGVEVNSTLPNNRYSKWDGTSVATPHVAGAAALVWSHFPQCSQYGIREALIKSAEDLGATGKDNIYGYGVVQAKAAYDYIAENGCIEKNQTTIYENRAQFIAATNAPVVEDFETWKANDYHDAKTRAGIEWSSSINMYIFDKSNLWTPGPITSHVLTSLGFDHLTMVFQQPVYSFGMDYFDHNGTRPNQITIYYSDGHIDTIDIRGDYTKVNFWGIESKIAISAVEWYSWDGGFINTALDNIRIR